MTPQQQAELTAAEAARDVPGVAYLSPGLGQRLSRVLLRRPADTAGVRAVRSAQQHGWHVDVAIAVRADYQAAAVARAVHNRVVQALHAQNDALRPEPVEVSVTVTAVV